MTGDTTLRVAVLGGTNASDVVAVLNELSSRERLAIVVHCGDSTTSARLRLSLQNVVDVRVPTKVEPGTIYVLGDSESVEVRDRSLVPVASSSSNNTLDLLFRSAADTYGAQAIGVILAGPGTSGLLGIKRIKEVGGITMAQAGDEVTGLSRTALASGMIDLVLEPKAIANRLQTIADYRPGEDRASDGDTLREILTLMRLRTGHDFSAYKRATLFRRISRRMQVCQTETVAQYFQHVREHANELSALLRDFLIGVTNFFRDRESFEVLKHHIIPKLFANKAPNEQVRVWVPGCATGEEVYSIAILLDEYATSHNTLQVIQLFATDIDEGSLADARNARYPESIAVDVGERRLERYFTREPGFYRVSKAVREMVLFSPHNLLRDPPFSRLDMVSCRNLLIYLNRDAQDRVLKLFHFALGSEGFLFLGSSESAENVPMFSSIDPKHRIYQRRHMSIQALDTVISSSRWIAPAQKPAPAPQVERTTSLGELHFRVVEQYAPPSVLINADLDVLHVSEHAGQFLAVSGGEPTKQLLRLVLPELRLDLRTAIYAARQSTRRVETRVVRFEAHGKPRVVELRVASNLLEDVAPGTLLVLFEECEVSPSAPEPTETDVKLVMEPVVRELEDDLRRTRDQLRTTEEQYETSLEELKASNEELQAINEELRSATEELETGKEELQSVNEELTTLNQELKVKVEEVSHANSDLQNLMTSTDIGVLFLDRQLNIKRFTPRARDLFNLIATDVGRPLSHLTHRVEGTDLTEQVLSVLQSLRAIEREVTSTEARRYLMRILPYRSLEDRIDGVVVTFVDVTELRATEAALAVSEERLAQALRIAPIIMLSIAQDGHSSWGYALGKSLSPEAATEMFAPGHADRLATIVRSVLGTRMGQRTELDVVIHGAAHTFDFRIEPMRRGVIAVGYDITSSKRAEESLRDVTP